ncbi:MAG: hypothetical protein A2172_01070 [Candidatus Woykebacteria bacterium RBG_13_40_15]|uniref:BioF2-like acetyltransferase domain-containing protein n=1 Tax=Candidatus Woykebacteria bacterium RBG_13_40_15 TaxID=1802593 RepID=A0A1G1W8W3_9BACT|nr:MAG: hypothetical protein A2172_01070 [Candidatus Woykebacteria bacterium RBG_13_40_15]
MDIRQSKLWAAYLERLGWESIKLHNNFFAYGRKIPFFGSVIKIPRLPLPIPIKEIDGLAKNKTAFMVKIEPMIEKDDTKACKLQSSLKDAGFLFDRWALNPTATIQIDLTKSEELLLKEMEKDTRYNIRLAERKGVTVKETNNLEQFKQIFYETGKRKGFWIPKKELEVVWSTFSKENSAFILTAFYQNEPIASTILLSSNRVALYYHAASLNIHREVMAPYLLLWESMKFLKNKGVEIFDLEGIKDPRFPDTKKWGGFTLFKKGFGGIEIIYLGSFVKYYKLWAKALFFPTRFF